MNKSDHFTLLPIERLAGIILAEYQQQDSIFGIHKDYFFKPNPGDSFSLERYGMELETPLGIAAGPHSQLAQNIICAWLSGARYIELKTVQTLDKLNITKPCIHMEDEGYNCEWSQELSLDESFHQYLDAWILLHWLREFLQFSSKGEGGPGFIFNMSVGYDMKGILAGNMQQFLDRMADSRIFLENKLSKLAALLPGISAISIPSRISHNVTLSTMHGCPPGEIEEIASYLMEEKKLHTTIKLNPTLLGRHRVRHILNQTLGYPVQVPDQAFEHDPGYNDALAIISTLREKALQAGVTFSLKLTNTLETINTQSLFAGKEKMIYMSGRALHPLGIELAARLQDDFDGELDISFAGGADCFNISHILACGLAPVTVCSDLLKPGGYTRLPQYLEQLEENPGPGASHRSYLGDYARRVLEAPAGRKDFIPFDSIKTQRELTPFDCIQAPCMDTCPTGQDIPGYMHHTSQGDFAAAFDVIQKDNPFPHITGLVCTQTCREKCTRMHYDQPLMIREVKRFVAENHGPLGLIAPPEPRGIRVGIIGAGPAGLSCAWFLALLGFSVEVYESNEFPGGMAAAVIPRFRLGDEDIRKDIDRITGMGVVIHYQTPVDEELFKELQNRYDYIYISIGTQKALPLRIPGEELENVMDGLSFLARVRRGESISLGQDTAIIGGGNSAFDAARSARRLVPPGGRVVVIYRRTQKEMPAHRDEIREAIEEGVELLELTAPCSISRTGGRLNLECMGMKLTQLDDSGRPRPVKVENSEFTLVFDTIITAVGQQVDAHFLNSLALKPNQKTGETDIPGVLIGGDALGGPATLVKAVADGKRAALKFMEMSDLEPLALAREKTPANTNPRRVFPGEIGKKKESNPPLNFDIIKPGMTPRQAMAEASRCLGCHELCNRCVSVCPNRANVGFRVEPLAYDLQKVELKEQGEPVFSSGGRFKVEQRNQVVHLADFCNHCGNCSSFCPSAGAPYLKKPRLCLTKEAFALEEDAFYPGREPGGLFILSKLAGKEESLAAVGDHYIYRCAAVEVLLCKDTLGIEKIDPLIPGHKILDFHRAAAMSLLLRYCPDFLFPLPA